MGGADTDDNDEDENKNRNNNKNNTGLPIPQASLVQRGTTIRSLHLQFH